MGLFSWTIFGALAGWLANMLVNGEKQGCFTNMLVGIAGSVIGGFIMNFLGGGRPVTGFNLRSLIVAVMGSAILLWVLGKGGRRK